MALPVNGLTYHGRRYVDALDYAAHFESVLRKIENDPKVPEDRKKAAKILLQAEIDWLRIFS